MGNISLPPLLPKWAELSPDTLEISSNKSQVWGIPCFGKSIEFQWHLFRHSFFLWETVLFFFHFSGLAFSFVGLIIL